MMVVEFLSWTSFVFILAERMLVLFIKGLGIMVRGWSSR